MTMTDADITRVARGFLDGTLPKEEWTHRAHFATALWLMIERPDINLEHELGNKIRCYNESVGGVNSDTSGYHETITLASIHMARAILTGLPTPVSPATALAALIASPLGDKEWPFTYWTRERLMSIAARRGWIAPDIAPLPV